MKITYENSKVISVATDAYDGPSDWVVAPEDFDVSRLAEYTMVDGVPTLPALSVTNKAKAVELLQTTDWSELPSVTNTSLTPHLINADEFASYRVIIRGIAVNPPDATVTWPAVPNANWSA